MKKVLLLLLTAIGIHNIDAKESAQDLLQNLVQYNTQESLTKSLFDQKIQKFIKQGGDINEPILINPFDLEEVEFMTFLDANKTQSLLSYALVFGEDSVSFVKTLLKYGANPLQKIYLNPAVNNVSSYEGTIFDSLLMTIISDLEGIQRNISLEVITNLLKNYDEFTSKKIIGSVFARFYELLDVSDKKELKYTINSLDQSNFILKNMLKEFKKYKNKNKIFILETITKQLEHTTHTLKLKLSKK